MFGVSESQYAYRRYAYKKECIGETDIWIQQTNGDLYLETENYYFLIFQLLRIQENPQSWTFLTSPFLPPPFHSLDFLDFFKYQGMKWLLILFQTFV